MYKDLGDQLSDEFVLEKSPGLLLAMEEFIQCISKWRGQWT